MSENRFDPDMVRQLADVLDSTGLNEIRYTVGEVKIEIVRHAPSASLALESIPQAPPQAALQPIELVAEAPVDPAQHPGAVKSPMVGNVYLAPEPGASPFIAVGDSIVEGQTLLIIEAMKVMNPIRAPRSGVVKKILVNNAAPVEYDEVLVIIE